MLKEVFTPIEWAQIIGIGALYFSAAIDLQALL